jgi:hypothetical protein
MEQGVSMLLAELSLPDLSLDKLQIFVSVILPGIVVLKIYDLFCPPQKRDFGSSLLEAAAFGAVNFGLWLVPLLYINSEEFFKHHPFWYFVISLWCLVVFPAVFGYVFYLIRTAKWFCDWAGYPAKTAWDDFFKRKRQCYVLCLLKNGKRIGGYFGGESYATTYPDDPELFLEQVWRVDQNNCLSGPVDGTLGMIIRPGDCDLIQFIKPKEMENGQKL